MDKHAFQFSLSRSLRRGALLCVGLMLAAAPLQAQKDPRAQLLPAGADINDPAEFIRFGDAQLTRDAARAAQAYHWATRLNPDHAEALYGRFVAQLLANPQHLDKWFNGDRKAMQQKDMAALDSLRLGAIAIKKREAGALQGERSS